MVHASLFSGIGGPEVAAAMLGWDNAFHCEINDFCRKILEYWFPNSKSYENIIETDFTEWRGKVDVLTGGFPCQPFSYAGQRKGHEDDRYLWPQMLRAIAEIRPTWVIGENVAGITTMAEQGKVFEVGCEESLFGEGDGLYHYRQRQIFTIERVCRDLEGAGYSVQPVIIPACAVGAPHRRDRIFIIAENTMPGGQLHGQNEKSGNKRNERNACTGNCERICKKKQRIDTAYTECIGGREIHKHIQSEIADGKEPVSNGREHDASDTNGIGLQEKRTEQQAERSCRSDFGETIADTKSKQRNVSEHRQCGRCEEISEFGDCCSEIVASNSGSERPQARHCGRKTGCESREASGWYGRNDCADGGLAGLGRWANFPTVSPIHRGNDGLPFDVDCLTIPFSKWRTESLKAYGNAIVPQVMYEIFLAIEKIEKGEQHV